MTRLTNLIPSRTLEIATGLAIAVAAILGSRGLDRDLQFIALALCAIFAAVWYFWFARTRVAFRSTRYFAVQAALATAVLLLRSTDNGAFTLLFFILCVQAMMSLPTRSGLAWSVLFYLLSSAGAVWTYGANAGPNVIFNIVTFCLVGAFGYTIRQADLARTQSQQLLSELRATQFQLQDLAVLDERNRLARELHDSVKQQVFAIGMQLGAARTTLQPDSEAYAQVAEAERLAQQAGQELTALIRTLRPPELENKTLAAALQTYLGEWSRSNHINGTFETQGEHRVPPQVEHALFRVAQEALTNVARHSSAQHVALALDYAPTLVTLSVQDDGHGFQPAQTPKGVGLDSMGERMAQVGGRFQVQGNQGSGTQVTAAYDYAEQTR